MEKILLKNTEVPEQYQLETYMKSGGYQAIHKAFKMSPLELVEEVKKSGLRGRGGAGFPTGLSALAS